MVDLRELRTSVLPPIIYETEAHAATCQHAAAMRLDDAPLAQLATLTNFYVKSAIDCANATAVAYAQQIGILRDEPATGEYDADAIYYRHAVAARQQDRLTSVSFRIRVVVKAVSHRLFRLAGMLAGSRWRACNTIVRSWVDVTLELVDIRIEDCGILVYPFPLNVRRQLRYLKQLKQNGYRFRLAGMPYSITRVLLWAIRPDDERIAAIEVTAARRHAEEIQKRYSPSQVLTTEEFEAGTFALGSELRSRGIRVTNMAHGVGKYSPYVSFDEFHVFNDMQESYYRQFGDVDRYCLYPREVRCWGMRNIGTLVLVDQLVWRDGSLLNQLQDKIVSILCNVAERTGLNVAVKLHPNSQLSPDGRNTAVEYTTHRHWADGAAMYLSVYSTAYLTFEENGPTLLVGNDCIDPRIVFGNDADAIHVDDLECQLLERLNVKATC